MEPTPPGRAAASKVGGTEYAYYSIAAAEAAGLGDFSRLPASLKVVLENMLRFEDGRTVTLDDIRAFSDWAKKGGRNPREIAYRPARVLMQDFTGVPAVVDLAAMRDAMVALGGDPQKINPLNPVDLVIDHSVMVDEFGNPRAFQMNVEREYQRNGERYEFLNWGQGAFANFRVVPPGTGICHQVNLEYLGQTVWTDKDPSGAMVAYPDTLVGTDSHTTMVNGLAILGWGVGGIEAEAAMLGQPISMLIPEVVGFKLTGALKEGVTATDLVLTVTQMLRKKGVVNKFVEFYGAGPRRPAAGRPGDDRQHGAGVRRHLRLLPDRRRDAALPARLGARRGAHRAGRGLRQGERLLARRRTTTRSTPTRWRSTWPTVEPSLAGPKRPQDRVALKDAAREFVDVVKQHRDNVGYASEVRWDGEGGAPEPRGRARAPRGAERQGPLGQGRGRGLPHPRRQRGDRGDHLLHQHLEPLRDDRRRAGGAQGAGAGAERASPGSRPRWRRAARWSATTSRPPGCRRTSTRSASTSSATAAPPASATPGRCRSRSPRRSADADLVACSVLSGNRNFEGRINPDVPGELSRLAAAGGRLCARRRHEPRPRPPQPLGIAADGKPVYLKDIWPSQREIAELVERTVTRKSFREKYADVFKGDDALAERSRSTRARPTPGRRARPTCRTRPTSRAWAREPGVIHDIEGARILALLGDSVTTDHISPAGSFRAAHPAGAYLQERQVPVSEFNSYGSRRGNHEVMMRGTFANIRIRNEMLDGVEGGYTLGPDGEQASIYDAAMAWQAQGVPLVVIAGKEYGTGSSRDWAAKGTTLLGVKAVIAESFERIHRSNLVGMGVIPLEFTGGDDRRTLGLKGDETISIGGLAGRSEAARRGAGDDHLRRRHGCARSGSGAGSIPRSRSSTSRTAACCTTCCATSPRPPEPHAAPRRALDGRGAARSRRLDSPPVAAAV